MSCQISSGRLVLPRRAIFCSIVRMVLLVSGWYLDIRYFKIDIPPITNLFTLKCSPGNFFYVGLRVLCRVVPPQI